MSKAITAVATPWEEIVVVCAKCSRKLKGGFGPEREDKLRTVLKNALRTTGRRRQVRVIEGACFGLCPKKAVTVVASRAPHELLVVPAGVDAAEALARISPATPPPP